MRARIELVIFLITLFVIVSGCGKNKSSSSPSAPNYFPRNLNNTWTYKNVCNNVVGSYTNIVTQSSNTTFTLKTTDSSWTGYGTSDFVSTNSVWAMSQATTYQPFGSSGTTFYSPPMPSLPSQTSLGTHETYTSTASPGNTVYTVDYTVSGSESVAVPAGLFDTIKLNIIQTYETQPSISHIIWYADGVGMVKEVWASGCTSELQAYTTD